MSRNWNSRRRVEVALAHREPDRIPLDLTITKLPYARLREHLGLPPEADVKGDRFGEVQPALDLLETLGIDIAFVKLRGPTNWTPPRSEDEGLILDEWGVGRKKVELPDGSTLLEVTYSPLQDKHPDEIDLDEISWPDPYDLGRIAGLEEEARRLYEETDLALMGRFGGTIMEQASFIRGYTQWLIDLKMHPEFARKLMNRITDIQIALDEIGIRAAGRYLTIFKLSGEDLGMQDRPMFSPQMWQEILRPVLKRRWQAARKALDRYDARYVKLMLHSDGAIRPFIPDLIEDGIDILDPVQVQCPGMEPDKLKRDFGAQLTFHGAIESQHVLPFGSVADVEAEVIRCLQFLGPGGGFIMAPVHNVQPDVPPENLVALFQAARKFGCYPL